MFTRLRRHLTYANIAATLAVVFAMSGGAYALSGGGHAPTVTASSTRGHVAKAHKHVQGRTVVRGPAGPKGAAGALGAPGPAGLQGPQGAAGTQGAKGAAGAAGAKGEAGPAGAAGKNGENVSATTLEPKNGSGHCENGGTEFKVGGHEPNYACNGEVAAGSGYPETMPPGRSVSGDWGVALSEFKIEIGGKEYEGAHGATGISFPVGLSGEQANKMQLHYVSLSELGNPPAGCSTSGEEGAEPGNVCVFENETLGGSLPTPGVSVNRSGVILHVLTFSKSVAMAWGHWVMTAPTE